METTEKFITYGAKIPHIVHKLITYCGQMYHIVHTYITWHTNESHGAHIVSHIVHKCIAWWTYVSHGTQMNHMVHKSMTYCTQMHHTMYKCGSFMCIYDYLLYSKCYKYSKRRTGLLAALKSLHLNG